MFIISGTEKSKFYLKTETRQTWQLPVSHIKQIDRSLRDKRSQTELNEENGAIVEIQG